MSFDRLFQSRMVLGKYDFENISFLMIGKRNELVSTQLIIICVVWNNCTSLAQVKRSKRVNYFVE